MKGTAGRRSDRAQRRFRLLQAACSGRAETAGHLERCSHLGRDLGLEPRRRTPGDHPGSTPAKVPTLSRATSSGASNARRSWWWWGTASPGGETVKSSPSIGALGKVPSHDEFLRVHASGGPFAAFDTWMLENLAWASSRGNRAWDDAFRQGGVQAFVSGLPRRAPPSPAGGPLGPSADRYGRLFPFAIAAELYPTSMLLGSGVTPVVLEDFWTQASVASSPVPIRRSTRSKTGSRVPARSSTPTPEALAPYHEGTRSLALADLFDLISLGGPHGASSRAIRWLRETVRPYQRTERPRTPLTLRLPLGQAGGAAVSSWLDLVQRLAGSPGGPSQASFGLAAGPRAHVLHLGRAPPRARWRDSGCRHLRR